MLQSYFWRKLLVRLGIARLLPSVKRLLCGAEQYLRYFSNRTLAVPVEELLDPGFCPSIHGPDAIDFAIGAPRCDIPLGAVRGINDRRALSAWGMSELRQMLRETDPHASSIACASEEVLITAGASAAFASVLDAFIRPGSSVVLFDPTSPIFPMGLRHRRAAIRWVPTRLEEGVTRFDIQTFTRVMRSARMLVLCDPCNPTGGVFAAEDLEQIAFWAKKNDTLIYLDESFAHYREDGAKNILYTLPNVEHRLIRANSFSKTYGLTNARVGWLRGHRHLLQACAFNAALNGSQVSPLCQHLALAALQSPTQAAERMREEYLGRKRYVCERLQVIGLHPVPASAGYFLWIPVAEHGLDGRAFSRQLLERKRVLVNPGDPFGPSGKQYIRMSFASEEGRLREGLARLAEFMMEQTPPRPSDEIVTLREALPKRSAKTDMSLPASGNH